ISIELFPDNPEFFKCSYLRINTMWIYNIIAMCTSFGSTENRRSIDCRNAKCFQIIGYLTEMAERKLAVKLNPVCGDGQMFHYYLFSIITAENGFSTNFSWILFSSSFSLVLHFAEDESTIIFPFKPGCANCSSDPEKLNIMY